MNTLRNLARWTGVAIHVKYCAYRAQAINISQMHIFNFEGGSHFALSAQRWPEVEP